MIYQPKKLVTNPGAEKKPIVLIVSAGKDATCINASVRKEAYCPISWADKILYMRCGLEAV